MTTEVGAECAVRCPAELGALSPEAEATQRPQEETRDDSSSGSGTDNITSGLASSTARSDLTEKSQLIVMDRLKEKICRVTEGEEGGDIKPRSGDSEDLASRENLQDCETDQQRLFPVSRSQYHSIQQLSRPSTNLARTSTSSRHLFGAERRPAYRLENSSQLYLHASHSSGQVPGSAAIPAGRYFTETGMSRDDKNSEATGLATECDRTQDDDGSDNGEEVSVSTDDSPTDIDHHGTDVHRQTSLESSQNGGGNTTVEDELEAKRARVEHIVRSMRTPPSDGGQASLMTTAYQQQRQQQLIDGRRQRRKQFAPLQHQHDAQSVPHPKRSYHDDEDDDSDRDAEDPWGTQLDNSERDVLRLGLQRVHDRLAAMQKKYMNYLNENGEGDVVVDVRTDEPMKSQRDDADDAVIGADFNRNEILRGTSDDNGPTVGPASGSLEALARMLKAEISDSVSNMVDDIVRSFVAQRLKVAGAGGGGQWKCVEPADGRLTPTQRSTTSTTSSPDTHLTAPPPTDSETIPPPLTPIGAPTPVDLRFPVPPPAAAVIPAGSMESMERAAAAAAKLVADRYSLQSAAAMAAYLDNAFLLHGKTAFEMPPSHAAATSMSPASSAHRLLSPTPYYPTQHSALHSHLIKVSSRTFHIVLNYRLINNVLKFSLVN